MFSLFEFSENEALSLPTAYEYSHFKSEVNGMISFRIKRYTKEDCIKWLNDYGDQQYVTWKILATLPRAGRVNLYKSVWRCQHNVYPKAKINQSFRSKHTGCQAKVTIFLKRYLQGSRSKDPEYHLNINWPCLIQLQSIHNHPLQAASALIHRPISTEVKEKLFQLFYCGHSASSAREALKLELFLNNVDSYYLAAADGKYLPSLSKIQHLLNSEFSKEYGSKSEDNTEMLTKLINKFNENNPDGKAIFGEHNKHKFVVFCTPIMARVHEYMPQSGEMIFVDAAGGMDRYNSRVYFFMTPTPAAALPLGVIITDSEETELFLVCLQNLSQCFPEKAFFGKLAPNIIMTDDDLKERKPLSEVFPNSVLLLCQFHVLNSVWKWILRNISVKEKRQELYYSFKGIMYEKSMIKAEQLYQNLMEICPFDNFNKYISNHKWPMRNLWMSAYRNNLPIRGNNTNNYVEVAFRILKDIILDRTKSYNMVQLTDFIMNKYECYVKRRCIDYANGTYLKSSLKKYMCVKSTIDIADVKQNDNGTYLVPSETTANQSYIVNAEEGFCTCITGSTGQLCKHISLILTNFKIKDTYFSYCSISKSILFKVATGKDIPKEWLRDLNSCPKKQSNNKTLNKSTEDIENIQNCDNSKSNNYLKIEYNVQEHLNKLDVLTERIKTSVATNPESFVPALKKMMENAEQYLKTDNALLTTMHTFGKYSGLNSRIRRNKKGIRHHSKIGVQPTSVARRKQGILGGKRARNSGRPVGISNPLKQLGHDYTAFNPVPPKKKRIPHNISKCVQMNKFVP